MFISLDEYYDIDFYNESIQALKNNDIDVKEFISIKPPYLWYFDLENTPTIVNFDTVSNSQRRFLVNKVQALRPNEEYLLKRRIGDAGQKSLLKYVENQPLKEARESDYSVFFTIKNREQLEQITKELPVKVYYFGKYYGNKYRVCLCNNKMIKNYLNKSDILLENDNEFKEPGRFEAELNYKVFRFNDMLEKYTETPYFKDGKYKQVKIQADRSMTI